MDEEIRIVRILIHLRRENVVSVEVRVRLRKGLGKGPLVEDEMQEYIYFFNNYIHSSFNI